jgi:hypothetical protein
MATTTTPDTGELRLVLTTSSSATTSATSTRARREPRAVDRALLLLLPLIVRPTSAGYELVTGYQRCHACRKLDLDDVPVVVREQGGLERRERGGETSERRAWHEPRRRRAEASRCMGDRREPAGPSEIGEEDASSLERSATPADLRGVRRGSARVVR